MTFDSPGPACSEAPGEAEVEDLRETLARDHHVCGLQVAVHDPARVGGREALGDLPAARSRSFFIPGEAPSPSRGRRASCLRRAPWRRRRPNPPRPTSAENGDDVGMIETRKQPSLRVRSEPGTRRSEAISGAEDLDGDASIEPRIARRVDLAHPPCAQRRQNLVRAPAASLAEVPRVGAGFYPASGVSHAAALRSARRDARSTAESRQRPRQVPPPAPSRLQEGERGV